MEIISNIQEMQNRMLAHRCNGKTIAFVPTMGFLHEGHLSLLREGRERGDILVLSIFVNPTQFGPNEDLDSYPKDLQQDIKLAKLCGVDVVFTPDNKAMYPDNYATYVHVEGLTETLCGAKRPGHFRGVATVVTRLFNIVQPTVALFGKKDFQQLAVIKRMTADLNLPIEIVGMPIIREKDGLALSSRNSYLSTDERQQALALSDAAQQVKVAVRQGEHDCKTLLRLAQERIKREVNARIDYIQICHDETLKSSVQVDDHSILLMAVYIGKTRLIDNRHLI